MATIDLIIVIIYLVLLFVVGIVVGLKETAEDFLILSRKAKAYLVLFSVVSSWVGIGTIVGTAAGGFDTGISVGFLAVTSALIGVVSVVLLAPTIKKFGDKFKAHTLGDFFRVRYSKKNQFLVGGIIILAYFLMTATQFTGLSMLLQLWTNLSFEITILIAALTTITYTAFAGIKSDFYTDIVHFWVMVLVLFGILFPIVLRSVGGFGALGNLPSSYFNPFSFGGITLFIGGIIFGIGASLISMEIWQKIYASENIKAARRALAMSILLIIAFYALAMFFGMATKILYPSLPNRDMAIFTLMKNQLPTGFLGLGVAAFLAVFISSVNTTIMVITASLTKDFYKGAINPAANDKQMLKAGRILTIAAGLAGLIFAYLVRDILTLSTTALLMLLVFLPAIFGGFFWKRATATASFYSILLGFICALFLLPKMPTTAFVPGFLVSLIMFVVLSFFTSHSKSEITELT